MKILNYTPYISSQDLLDAGVEDHFHVECVKQVISFDDIPKMSNIAARLLIADSHLILARDDGFNAVLLDNSAPWIVPQLIELARGYGLKALFSFSRNEKEEVLMSDGGYYEVDVRKHVGFVEAY